MKEIEHNEKLQIKIYYINFAKSEIKPLPD